MNNQTLEKKLKKIKELAKECLVALSGNPVLKSKPIKAKGRGKKVTTDYILPIVNKIKNCDEFDQIEKEILDKSSLAGKILLPFYICYKHFPEQGLKTGDIAKITSELRVKVQTPNVSKTISNSIQKYLDGDSTRVKGKPVVYKLNRKGAKYFESLIKPDEQE